MSINVAAPTAVPELTAEQVQRILVKPLEDVSIILSSGVRIFDSNGSPVRIPKLGGPVDPNWHGESEQIGERDVEFDEVVLLPADMASVKVLTRFSNELARQSVVALDAALRDRLVRDVASKIDRAFIAGDGAVTATGKKTPRGIINTPGVQTMTAVGSLTLDDLHDAEGTALAADVDPTKLKWFMRSGTFVHLRKIKDSSGKYLIQPDPTEAGAYRLLGHGVTVTNRLPAGFAFVGDMSQIAVARDMAPSVKVLDQTFADFDQQAIRVVARYDIGALNAEAVIVLSGITES